MIHVINFLIGFILIYVFLFAITFVVTRIHCVTTNLKQKKIEEEKGIIKKRKKRKEIKRTWNENLGVWEID